MIVVWYVELVEKINLALPTINLMFDKNSIFEENFNTVVFVVI